MQATQFQGENSNPANVPNQLYAVLRFKRRIALPRFTMEAGGFWGFVVYGKSEKRLEQIKSGERFDFAGAQVLAQDVEIIYEGQSGLEYSVALGYITDSQIIASLRNSERKHLR